MANTFIEYTGNGSTTNYSFTFEYIKQAEVKVTLDGAATTAFSFANATTLSFTTAPASGVKIRIYRETDVSSLKATFFPGSAIKAEDLNDNFTQNNFAVEEVRESTWDVDTETIKSNETWVSSDDQIATTAAMDARFQDEVSETFTKAELAANSNVMPNNDTALPTTGALNDYIDEVITNDIGSSDGVTITDDGDGTITVGLGASSVDLDRIKNSDIITSGEQDAGSPAPSDNNIFTAYAAARRFDGLVQTGTPSGSDWETGKLWLQNDNDKTLHMWNGSMWLPLVSGGSFTKLSKVIYVDSINGDDTLDGHRISNPKKTIKAAVADINSDSDGDGSLVIVAPGIYGETFPIDIQKNDVGIVGTALRNCIIHPAIPAADQAGYDVNVPEANELTTMFRVNSGSYFYGLTLTGMKASGTRGGNSLDTDSTYGLPTNQGWNFAFYPNAQIKKSPYIQNCTNFSDSRVNNVNFTPHTPGEGAAGDLTSAPTGGGILVNGATVASNSPLRSMVADSYTHTALDGPGVFVTNNGYTQITSSYAFFNHYHIKCLNGGQANLAASTSDFGRYGLLVDGRSTSAIFTATTTATAADGAITFTIGAPTAGANWHGSATRPQGNMLVDIGGNTYPILSAVAAGSGWTVTISRPNPNKRDENLGLDGAVSSGATVNFYLRSMIASSGHTMEYVGSGTDYRALPENGGVPVEANQVVELNNGKVWTATTDHNGKFKVGDFFTVDQRTGFVTVPVGSISFPKLAEDLVVNGHEITSESNGNVVINPDGTGIIELGSKVGIGTTTPAYTLHVQDSSGGQGLVKSSGSTTSRLFFANTGTSADNRVSVGATNEDFRVDAGGNERLRISSAGKVGIGTTDPGAVLEISSFGGSTNNGLPSIYLNRAPSVGSTSDIAIEGNSVIRAVSSIRSAVNDSGYFSWSIGGTDVTAGTAGASEVMRITSAGNVGIGTTSPNAKLSVAGSGDATSTNVVPTEYTTQIYTDNASLLFGSVSSKPCIQSAGSGTSYHLLLNPFQGNVGIGSNSPGSKLTVYDDTNAEVRISKSGGANLWLAQASDNSASVYNDGAGPLFIKTYQSHPLVFSTGNTERMRINATGNVGIGTTTPSEKLSIFGADPVLLIQDSETGLAAAQATIRLAESGANASLDNYWDIGPGPSASNFAFKIGSNAAVNALAIRHDNGNVGIGTTSPSEKLQVNGNVLLNSDNARINLKAGIGGTTGALNFTFNTTSTVFGGLDLDYDTRATTGLRLHSGYPITLESASSQPILFTQSTSGEKMRIDSSGRLTIGYSASVSQGGFTPTLQQHANSAAGTGVYRWSNNSGAPVLGLAKSRGAAPGTNAIVQNNDPLGSLTFSGDDGTDLNNQAASITANVDGTPGSNNMPGRLVFSTTADGANSPTERMRIRSDGNVSVGDGGNSYQKFSINGSYPTAGINRTEIFSARGNFRETVNEAWVYISRPNVNLSASDETIGALGHFVADPQNTLTQGNIGTQYGFVCGSSLTAASNNYGFYSNIASGTGRWNFYANGTAQNYFAGDVLFYQNSSNAPGVSNTTEGACLQGGRIFSISRGAGNSLNLNRNTNDGDVAKFYRQGNLVGSISVTTSATAYNTSSDYRLKENVTPMVGAADRVKALKPCRFNFITDATKTVDGFLAHEAQEVVPESVTGTKDAMEDIGTLTEWDGTILETNTPEPDSLTWDETITDEDGNETVETRTRTWVKTGDRPVMQGIDQAKLVPLLTGALQEALAEIDALKQRLTAAGL